MSEQQRYYQQNVYNRDTPQNIDTVPVKKEVKGESESKEQFSFKNYFLDTTTICGPTKVASAPNVFLQAYWLLLLCASCCTLVVYTRLLFINYFEYPADTFIELKYGPLPYPDVTICNVNPIKKFYMNETSCHLQHTVGINKSDMPYFCRDDDADYKQMFQFYIQKNSTFCAEDDQPCNEFVNEEINSWVKEPITIREQITEGINKLNGEKRVKFGHQFKDLVLTCKLNGSPCKTKKWFRQFLSSEYGNCITWTADKSSRPDAIGSGPDKGLEIVLNLEAEEYIQHYSADVGFRVMIHERNTLPIPSKDGFIVSGGQETNIALRLVNNSRLGRVHHRECYDSTEFKDIYGRLYNEEACRSICLGNKTMETCLCYPPDFVDVDIGMKNNHLLCPYTESLCVRIVESIFARNASSLDKCGFGGCPHPCSRVSYESRVTTTVWPSHTTVMSLEKDVCNKNRNTNVKCFNAKADKEARRRSFAKLNVYFETLNYVYIREEIKHTILSMLSDLGGISGIFLGISLLSIAEGVEVLIYGMGYMFKRLCQTEDVNNNAPSGVNASPGTFQIGNSNSTTNFITPTKSVHYREP